MTALPVPDFNFESDDDVVLPLPSPHCCSALSPAAAAAISESTGLMFDPKNPKSCTSNSAVYEARSADGSLWAAKISSHIRRAQIEAFNRNSLPSSQFLVKTVDLVVISPRAILQMEFCEGGDLNFMRMHSDTRKFPETVVWQLIHNIGSALAAIHSSGWMHLDVSPGNILNGNGMFKLADFGTLTEIGRFEQGREGAGPYASQEALEFPGRFQVSGQTDIFSFGVVLLEAISGKLAPRGGSKAYTKLRQEVILPGSKEYKCDCSYELVSLVNEMLFLDPAGRPTAAELVTRACEWEKGLNCTSSGERVRISV
jgi:serine/threonine protein kinase